MATGFCCEFSSSQKTGWRLNKARWARRGTAGSFRAGSRANGRGGNKRKAKCYQLTAAGKSKLQTEAEKWNRMADVIAGILESTPEGI